MNEAKIFEELVSSLQLDTDDSNDYLVLLRGVTEIIQSLVGREQAGRFAVSVLCPKEEKEFTTNKE